MASIAGMRSKMLGNLIVPRDEEARAAEPHKSGAEGPATSEWDADLDLTDDQLIQDASAHKKRAAKRDGVTITRPLGQNRNLAGYRPTPNQLASNRRQEFRNYMNRKNPVEHPDLLDEGEHPEDSAMYRGAHNGNAETVIGANNIEGHDNGKGLPFNKDLDLNHDLQIDAKRFRIPGLGQGRMSGEGMGQRVEGERPGGVTPRIGNMVKAFEETLEDAREKAHEQAQEEEE
jgi:hypothetical protein